jgi:glycosyltransferase EpsD
LKVLFVTTISNTINSFLIPHIKLLVEMGHHVDIACSIEQEIHPQLISLGCIVFNVKFQRSPLNVDNIFAYKKIKQLVLYGGYELIHTHTPIASFITRLACRNIPNVKVLYTAHGFHFYEGAPLKNWFIFYPLEKLAARWTDGLITINSEDYKRASSMQLRKNNSVFKINGVGINLHRFCPQSEKSKSEIRKRYGFNEDDVILIFVAELNYNKHQDLLINVINSLKGTIPKIKLLLVGSGKSFIQYQKQVKRLGLEEHVCFLGYRDDIEILLQISDFAVSSSRREGLPVNIMEAMGTGLPLVVSNCRGNRDLVTNSENGYVVEKNDLKGFVEAIKRIYNSAELRFHFKNNNLRLVKQYSLDVVIDEMREIYRHFLFEDDNINGE